LKRRKDAAPPTRTQVLVASLIAHVLGIPLALVILLAPAHPYTGLDQSTNAWRSSHLRNNLRIAYRNANATSTDKGLQPFTSLPDFLRKNTDLDLRRGSDAWAQTFEAAYGRFDLSEQGRVPLASEINPAALKLPNERAWLLRIRYPSGYLT